jgi:prophage DNA circulation protein
MVSSEAQDNPVYVIPLNLTQYREFEAECNMTGLDHDEMMAALLRVWRQNIARQDIIRALEEQYRDAVVAQRLANEALRALPEYDAAFGADAVVRDIKAKLAAAREVQPLSS